MVVMLSNSADELQKEIQKREAELNALKNKYSQLYPSAVSFCSDPSKSSSQISSVSSLCLRQRNMF